MGLTLTIILNLTCYPLKQIMDNPIINIYLSLPNKVGRHIVFAPFLPLILLLFFFIFFHFFSFRPNFVGQVFSNHWTDCSEISGYGRYGCEVVQQGFKMSDSKDGQRACPKLRKICRDYFLLTTERIELFY